MKFHIIPSLSSCTHSYYSAEWPPRSQCLAFGLNLISISISISEFVLKIRTLSALAFLPTRKVVEAFDMLIDHNIIPHEADRRGRRRAPKFHVAMWSYFNKYSWTYLFLLSLLLLLKWFFLLLKIHIMRSKD